MKKTASFFCLITLALASPRVSAQWLQTNPEVNGLVEGVGIIDSSLFAGMMFNLDHGGVFRSDDNGDHWIHIDSSFTYNVVSCLATLSKNLFVAMDSGHIFRSTDKGATWTSVALSATEKSIYSLVAAGSNLYAATNGDGVYLSQDSGSSWRQLGLPRQVITSFAVQDSILLAGTAGHGVFISTNAGAGWSLETDQPDFYITAVGINQLGIFAGTGNGFIFQSSDLAKNWRGIAGGLITHNPDGSILANVIACINSRLIIGASQGVFVGNIKDSTWSFTNTGCANITSLVYRDPFIFAGVSGGVWRRALTEILASAPPAPHTLPDEFRLEQNYPNPFNPSTIISFQIPATSSILLEVFDLHGKRITTLLSKVLARGHYSITWEPVGTSSGVYFCRLISDRVVKTIKLILLR